MKFPNAAKGVKKLFTAEVLSLIASIATIIGIILLFAACGAYIRYRSQRARDKQREDDQLREKAAAEGGEAE